ncbi:MAG: hypothetical protein RL301_794 [Actinomycetota bacterium]
MRKYLNAVLGVAFVFIFAFVLHLVRTQISQTPNFPTREIAKNEATVAIEVNSGASGLVIAKQLEAKGITASTTIFYELAIADKRSALIAPGIHNLNRKISAKQALEQLLDPKRISGLIAIREGQWRSEIAKMLIVAGFKSRDVENAFARVKVPKGFSNSEGIYFPAQYSFDKSTSAQQAVQSMVDRFVKEATKVGLMAGDEKFTPYQLLTMASLVQAEGDPTDFAKISRVIRNRLKIGMALQLDTSVQYVQKRRGEIYLTTKATTINSPYNTYRRSGLPIGPIGSPGVAAMKATLQPEKGDWIFFITVAPGDTRFTASHDEFLKWKDLYLKNYRAGLFRSK